MASEMDNDELFGVCLFSESVKGFLAIMCKLFLHTLEEAVRGGYNNYINLRVLLVGIAEGSVFHNHVILRQKKKDRTDIRSHAKDSRLFHRN